MLSIWVFLPLGLLWRQDRLAPSTTLNYQQTQAKYIRGWVLLQGVMRNVVSEILDAALYEEFQRALMMQLILIQHPNSHYTFWTSDMAQLAISTNKNIA